jgi:hypothetical protein
VVDEVAVQVLGDHALRLGLHPRRHERRQVAHRDAVEHELLADQPHRVDRPHPVLGQVVVGRGLEQEPVAVRGGELVEVLDQRIVGAVRRRRAVLAERHGLPLTRW